jgi:hypothetical protein
MVIAALAVLIVHLCHGAELSLTWDAPEGGWPVEAYRLYAAPNVMPRSFALLLTTTGTAATVQTQPGETVYAVTAVYESDNSNELMTRQSPPVIVDAATLTGAWTPSTWATGYYGPNYLHDGNAAKGTKAATFRPVLPTAGQYDVALWWPVLRAGYAWVSNVPVDIVGDETNTVSVNQRQGGGAWAYIGTFGFEAGTGGYVRIRTTGTTGGYVVADAVRFSPVVSVVVSNQAAAMAAPVVRESK